MSYREFSRILHEKGISQGLPLGVTVELTERCNLNCAHCYINQPAGDREAQSRELTTRQWRELLDEMAAHGALWLLFTGGEPLLRPDFREIYTHAKKLGMIINLFTNANLITEEFADFLQDMPPFMVGVTVYGRTRVTYEAVTRTPGSYDKCLRGIDLLLARGLPLDLKTMVMTINAHEVWDLKDWAADLGFKLAFDPVLNARLDGGKGPLELRLAPEEVVNLDVRDERRSQALKEFSEKFMGTSDSEFLYTCSAGVGSFHVDAYGFMFICMMSRAEGFNLTRGSVAEGLHDLIPRLRGQKVQKESPCRRCRFIALCSNCPAMAALEHGDPEAQVDYLCEIVWRRVQALGLKTLEELVQ